MLYNDARKTGLYVTGDADKPDILALVDAKTERYQKRIYAIRHKKIKRFLFASADWATSQVDYYLTDYPCLSTMQGCNLRMAKMKFPHEWEIVEIGFKVIGKRTKGDYRQVRNRREQAERKAKVAEKKQQQAELETIVNLTR